ncbi:MAG TPA: glutamine amidotransferase [Pirellulaceae bacterium]|nr:glutamine amidotransferase [Pirellulaceae bacterium]HMO93258.1 glutamine amidotransferase [Pirellulaceae bacterium]HMP69123.1 glutamine amidotransferase [Pirellulaceae bacterium]
MNQWTFEPIAGPLVIAVFAAVLCALLFLKPNFVSLNPAKIRALVTIRMAIIALAFLCVIRPGCVTQVEQVQTGVVQIFVDTTRSMQLPHGPSQESRYEALKTMISKNADKLRQLDDSHIKVRWFAFDTEIEEIDMQSGQLQLPPEANGDETDIGTSLFAGLQLVRNQRLLASVLASDGNQNAIDPPIGLYDAVRSLSELQVPLFTIPFGQADQSEQLADLAIENLADQYSVRANNTMRVTATLTARGFAGQQIPVQLIIIDRAGNEQVVDTQRISLSQGFEQRPIQLSYTPDRAGQYQMIVRAPPQPNETALANNELPSFLTVEDRGVSVLYLHGNLSWEQKFLRAALSSDSVISIDSFAIDHRLRRNWPLDLSTVLNSREYDVVILGDVDSRSIYNEQFQAQNLATITEMISRGKGFLMLGGKHSFGAGLYHRTPLADYLPIVMESHEVQDMDEPTRMDLHLQGPLRAKPKRSHFTTRLGQGKQGGDVWEELPSLDIANRIKPKSTAIVLLSTEADDPLLVATTVGGRVLAFAADSTWRWRTQYSNEIHARFWRQIILWLAGQDEMIGDDVWIAMQQRRFNLGQEVTFQAGITSLTGEAAINSELDVTLVHADGTQISLDVRPSGEYFTGVAGRQQISTPGLYTLQVAGRLDGRELGQAEAQFVIVDDDREKSTSGADPELLARLAYQTTEWGGRLVDPEDFSLLLDELRKLAPSNKILTPKRWRLGDTWQDSLSYLLVFVGLLAVEWILRKRWAMV